MTLWKRFLIRLRNYEFWPFAVFYMPGILYYLWLSAKHRSFFFFNAANPSIETGGMLGESKWSVFQLLPSALYPTTVKLEPGIHPDTFKDLMDGHGLMFPVILKPDIGERGKMVEKIRNEAGLKNYLDRIKVSFLLQEWIGWPLELGIFYVRLPEDKRGRITSIVRKGFLSVTGNGKDTIFDLLQKNKRALLQFDFGSDFYVEMLNEVLPRNEMRIIESIGNHCRGTVFYNDNHQIDEELNEIIDGIAMTIPEFYFGRFDIRTTSYKDLREGRNFSILELNGAGAEPGHIYDPAYSFWQAQKDVLQHLSMLSAVSASNEKRGHQYMSFLEGMRKFDEIRRYTMT